MSHARQCGPAWAFGIALAALAIQSTAQTPAAQGRQTASPATVPPAMASGTSTAAAPLSASDKKFMQSAAQDGMAEVQMGQLAAQKAADPQVKQFAERMIADHTKAGDKLKQIAAGKNVQLPSDIASPEKRMHDKLSKLSGAEFDREYMKHMVSDHKKATSEFRNATKAARDAGCGSSRKTRCLRSRST